MQRYSSKLNIQLLSETFVQSGIQDIVISPGSRNGGLTMQFVNEDNLNCYSIVDERCAAFVALGIAQKTQKPVVVCCTSGSAAVNYYSAVTEAFYQNVPLIVLTADRPEGYTDLFDGQTIRQENVFEKHSYCNVQLSEEETDDVITDNFLKIKKAIHTAITKSGPVHINVPFSEPLYDATQEKRISFDKITFPEVVKEKIDWAVLEDEYYASQKVMFLVGQQLPDKSFQSLLDKVAEFSNVIVLTETTSNLHNTEFISQIDAVLRNVSEDEIKNFQPDLLITLGQNVISKKIKQFLRIQKPKFHWHIDEYWHPDTYFSLTQCIQLDVPTFLYEFLNEFAPLESSYKSLWLDRNTFNLKAQKEFMQEIPWSDLYAFETIIANYPAEHVVHYSNSSVIRYSQLFRHKEKNLVYCNRGTSGIDGSTSTAIGYAMRSDKPVVLVTGDISFFYDSNALWNNYIPNSFRIILINNGGGNIFKIIPGPSSTNALEKFFETKHELNASHLADMFGFEYLKVQSKEELNNAFKTFYLASDKPKVLEVNTKLALNAETLQAFIKM